VSITTKDMSKNHNRNGHSYLTDLVSAVLSSANAKSNIVDSIQRSGNIQTSNVLDQSLIHDSNDEKIPSYLPTRANVAASTPNHLTRTGKTQTPNIVETEMRERKRVLDDPIQFPPDKKPRNALEQFVKMNRLLQTTEKHTRRSVPSRRLACKARGMGDSHTPANAFFDIPHDLMHGAVLACSHPECSGSGRRFRYCQGTRIN
jgi:hypothetical protein